MSVSLSHFAATVHRRGITLEPDGSPLEAGGVLNPGCARGRNGELLLYPRVVEPGNISRIGLVRATSEGAAFERLGFVLEPEMPYEHRPLGHGGMGCEDPRVTFVPVLDRFLMAYTAFGPDGPRVAFAHSSDGYAWERIGLADFATHGLLVGDDKDAAFFPEPVRSPRGVTSLAFYHRPMLIPGEGQIGLRALMDLPANQRGCTRIGYVPLDAVQADIANLRTVTESALVLAPDGPWGRVKTGAGTPPVRIAEGWLSLYHGVDAVEVGGRLAMTYCVGLVVHDALEPHHIRYRSAAPILTPESERERVGVVGNVVFPTGIDRRGERSFDVYYGMADAAIGAASLELAPALVSAVRSSDVLA